MDTELGPYQPPTVSDFQRNLDTIVHGAEREARKVTPEIQSQLAARGLAQSGAAIKAVVERADKIHAETLDRCMNLIAEFTGVIGRLPIKTLVEATRPRFESFGALLLSIVPNAGAQNVAHQVRSQFAAVFQQRLDGALKDIGIGFINGRRLKMADNSEGDAVLDRMLEDRVTLVKPDGKIERENIPSLVMKGKIQIHDVSLPIEIGDHLLRNLPNGLVEDYIVDDPVMHSGLGKKFFSIQVRRSSAPMKQQNATVQNITNNFHGSHSRVNINSTDNSINNSSDIGIEKLQAFLDQIKPALGGLPPIQQQEITVPLAVLEGEVLSGSPTKSKVSAALQSIKTIAEGAAGNLIAAGIVGLINSIPS